jgi:hypothetical protein
MNYENRTCKGVWKDAQELYEAHNKTLPYIEDIDPPSMNPELAIELPVPSEEKPPLYLCKKHNPSEHDLAYNPNKWS